MDEEHYEAGETVIKQGENGDCLYIVEEVNLNINKIIEAEENKKKTEIKGKQFDKEDKDFSF